MDEENLSTGEYRATNISNWTAAQSRTGVYNSGSSVSF